MKKKYIAPEMLSFRYEAVLPIAASFFEDGNQATVTPDDEIYEGNDWGARGDRRNVWDEEDDLDRSDRGGW